jgi:hypothetical protein
VPQLPPAVPPLTAVPHLAHPCLQALGDADFSKLWGASKGMRKCLAKEKLSLRDMACLVSGGLCSCHTLCGLYSMYACLGP